MENKFQKHFNFDYSHQDSSDNSDTEEHFQHLSKKAEAKTPAKAELAVKKSLLNGGDVRKPLLSNSIRRFLPIFEEDNQIKDALSYFCCVKDIDELRKEWKESREKMVEVF